MGFAGDLIMKSMDLPYAEDIGERMKAMLPPQIQQQMNEGAEVPPEVQQMMQQAQQAMQQVEQYAQVVQAAADELKQDESVNKQQLADIKIAVAQLKQAEAEFKAEIAQEVAGISQKEAGLSQKEAGLTKKGAELAVRGADLEGRAKQIGGDVSALDLSSNIDEILAQFMQAADSALGTVNDNIVKLQAKSDRKPVGGTTRRENGRIIADVEFSDGSRESVSAVRDKGGLRIVPD
jgi:chromosome segregation ATPase